MLDYESLKLVWWAFVGVLLIGFALMDGFDLGIGTLLPFLGRNDDERRVIVNSIGATWEGNQTWFVTAGGATFAAWPLVYAAAFSGFYVAMLLVLFALFFRPAGIVYRSKIADPRWRNFWDWGVFIAGAVPAIVFGVAFGNLLQGVPFRFDAATMAVTYTGTFWQLLNPTFLQIRTEGIIEARARTAAKVAGAALIVLFALAGFWVAFGLHGYRIVTMPPAGSAFMPLAKTVAVAPGGWLANYAAYPWMSIAPIAAFVGAAGAIAFSAWGRARLAFLGSAAAVAGVILTAGFAMFPFVMPSATDPNSSLTAWDAVSSHRTLGIMFWVVVFMLPVVIAYTAWVFRVLRGKITVEHIRETTHTSY